MSRFVNIFINPFFLAFIFSFIIYYFFLPNYNKYTIEKIKHEKAILSQQYLYDLDNDGLSEWIDLQFNYHNKSFPSAIIYTGIEKNWSSQLVNQINWKKPWLDQAKLVFGDYNNDDNAEIFVFTVNKDSLFLLGLDPLANEGIFLEKFITKVNYREGFPDFNLKQGQTHDLNSDGFEEVIFLVTGGFSLKPRALFAYDIKNDTLLKSNYEYAYIYPPIRIVDDPEFGPVLTANSYAAKNFKEENTKFLSDTSAWLMAFDKNLDFIFPPVEVQGNRPGVQTFPVLVDSTVYIYAFFRQGILTDTSKLVKLSLSGKILAENQFCESIYGSFYSVKTSYGDKLYLRNRDNSFLRTINPDLSFGKVLRKTEPGKLLRQFDVDGDRTLEIISYNANTENLQIFRKDFRDRTVFSLQKNMANERKPILVSQVKLKDNMANLCVSWGDDTYLLNYSFNAAYYFKYPTILGIYILLTLFFYFLLKFQKRTVLKKFEREKHMTELELLTIKNQIDPHFTFNAINTLSSIFFKEDKKTAHEFLVDLSSLIRNTLNNSKKISITLKDETEFVKSYLKLQQFRYADKFDFTFDINPNVDLNISVPRMIIQTFAENAVKHGLVNKEGKGKLEITIRQTTQSGQTNKPTNTSLQIEITDNGIGRKKSKQVQNYKQISTGKGHEIINQIVEMYNRLNKVEVRYEIIDIKDSSEKITGTKVTIVV